MVIVDWYRSRSITLRVKRLDQTGLLNTISTRLCNGGYSQWSSLPSHQANHWVSLLGRWLIWPWGECHFIKTICHWQHLSYWWKLKGSWNHFMDSFWIWLNLWKQLPRRSVILWNLVIIFLLMAQHCWVKVKRPHYRPQCLVNLEGRFAVSQIFWG